MRQLLWAPCLVPHHPHREEFLLFISGWFREHSPVPLGPVPLPEFVDNTNHLLGHAVLSPRAFHFKCSTGIRQLHFLTDSDLSCPVKMEISTSHKQFPSWAGKTSWSPSLILSFVIQANCCKPNWVQPSSPGALFGPSKGRFSSMFKAYSTSTAQKIKPDIPLQKKKRPKNQISIFSTS